MDVEGRSFTSSVGGRQDRSGIVLLAEKLQLSGVACVV